MTIHSVGHSGGRPIDALLAGYAAGTLAAPLHSLVAAHLELSPANRHYVASLENAAAAALQEAPVVAPRNRNAMLDAIFAAPALAAKPRQEHATRLPGSLVRYLGHDLNDVAWRTLLPGIREFHVGGDEDQEEATLYWIRAGKRLPSHTHEGSEITLVIQGGFTDASGHYARGDIAIADGDVDHHPTADADMDCICFAVTDAPLRLTGPVGRIVQRLFRH